MGGWHDFCGNKLNRNRATLTRFLCSLVSQKSYHPSTIYGWYAMETVNRVRLAQFLLSVYTAINCASLTWFTYRPQNRTFLKIKLKRDISVFKYFFIFFYVKKPEIIFDEINKLGYKKWLGWDKSKRVKMLLTQWLIAIRTLSAFRTYSYFILFIYYLTNAWRAQVSILCQKWPK